MVDAMEVARAAGVGGRINTVMQTSFFAISGVLPSEEAIVAIKHSIEKIYGKRGESIVRKHFAAVDSALQLLYEVKVPERPSAHRSSFGKRQRVKRYRLTGDAGSAGSPFPVASAVSFQAVSAAGGMKLRARSASAVMVRLGLTPRLAATTDPSQMYMFL